MKALICRMRACRRVSGRTDDSQPSCSEKAAGYDPLAAADNRPQPS
jgi:hypothetical protein